jgi:hypothetical protein
MQIEVRAKKGRIARTAPDGPFIPEDEYVLVEMTPYINRLLNHWGDIEQRPPAAKAATTTVAPPPKPEKPATKKTVAKEEK